MLDNSRHEVFAQKWHETENKTLAYKYAYPEKVEKWKEDTINNAASALSRKSLVLARYESLKQETATTHGITIESLLSELDEIKALAMTAETPQCSAAVTSVMSKARLTGLDIIKVEVASKEALTPFDMITIGVATREE